MRNSKDGQNKKIEVIVEGKSIDFVEYINTSQDPIVESIRDLCKLGEIKIADVKKVFVDLGGEIISGEIEILKKLIEIYPILCEKHNQSPNAIQKVIPGERRAVFEERAKALGIELPDIYKLTPKQEEVLVPKEGAIIAGAFVLNLVEDKYKGLDEETAQRFIQSDIEYSMTTLDLYKSFASNNNLTQSEQKVNIEKKIDADILLEVLHYISGNKEINGDEFVKKFSESKYFEDVIDSKTGQVDKQKAKKLIDDWIEAENTYTANEYVKNLHLQLEKLEQPPDFEKMSDEAKNEFALIIARGYFSNDKTTKKYFEKICAKIGIKNTEGDVINFVNSLVPQNIRTQDDLVRLKKSGEVNLENCEEKLIKIGASVGVEGRKRKEIYNKLESLKTKFTEEQIKSGAFEKLILKLYCNLVSDKRDESKQLKDEKLSNANTKYLKEFIIEQIANKKEFEGFFRVQTYNGKKRYSINLLKIRGMSDVIENEEEILNFINLTIEQVDEIEKSSYGITDAEMEKAFVKENVPIDISAIEEANRLKGRIDNARKKYSYGRITDEDEKILEFNSPKDIEELGTIISYIIKLKKYPENAQEYTQEIKQKYPNSMYLSYLISSETNVLDLDKANNFKNKCFDAYNKISTRNDINNLLEQINNEEFTIPQDDIVKNNMALILARGFFAEDEETRRKFEEICLKLEEKMGITKGTDTDSVIKLVDSLAARSITDIVGLNHFKTMGDIDDRNYLKKLKKIPITQAREKKLETSEIPEKSIPITDDEVTEFVEKNGVIMNTQEDRRMREKKSEKPLEKIDTVALPEDVQQGKTNIDPNVADDKMESLVESMSTQNVDGNKQNPEMALATIPKPKKGLLYLLELAKTKKEKKESSQKGERKGGLFNLLRRANGRKNENENENLKKEKPKTGLDEYKVDIPPAPHIELNIISQEEFEFEEDR